MDYHVEEDLIVIQLILQRPDLVLHDLLGLLQLVHLLGSNPTDVLARLLPPQRLLTLECVAANHIIVWNVAHGVQLRGGVLKLHQIRSLLGYCDRLTVVT